MSTQSTRGERHDNADGRSSSTVKSMPASQSSRKDHKSKNWFSVAFNKFAKFASTFTGNPAAFCLAIFVVVVWGISGPIFEFSDTWQLVINTGTTIVTFLMVFLIQNTQNRDMAATHIKLDELIRALSGAHNTLLDLEEMEEGELEKVRARYEQLAKRSRELLENGESDCECVELEKEEIEKDEIEVERKIAAARSSKHSQ